MMMNTMMALLILMAHFHLILDLIDLIMAKNENNPHSHTTTLLDRSMKCFEYDVKEGQVIEVKYSVIDRDKKETTINFWFFNSEGISIFHQLNQSSGSIRSTDAVGYNDICFENMSPDIKYVGLEVVMKGEVMKYATDEDDDDEDDDDNGISQLCLGRHMISKQAGLGATFHILVHERSDIRVINCSNVRCNQMWSRLYNWFTETFANIYKTCEDGQDLEVIYRKFVDLLKEFEGSIYSKDIIKEGYLHNNFCQIYQNAP